MENLVFDEKSRCKFCGHLSKYHHLSGGYSAGEPSILKCYCDVSSKTKENIRGSTYGIYRNVIKQKRCPCEFEVVFENKKCSACGHEERGELVSTKQIGMKVLCVHCGKEKSDHDEDGSQFYCLSDAAYPVCERERLGTTYEEAGK